MRIRVYYAPLLLAVVVALHFLAHYGGIYRAQRDAGLIWWDNMLHALVGVAFGMAWLWWVERREWNISPFLRIVSTLGIVFTFAILWELVELTLITFAPDFALKFNLYSTNLSEATFDSLSNLLGAVAFLLIIRLMRHAA